jgi:hypothetical protein
MDIIDPYQKYFCHSCGSFNDKTGTLSLLFFPLLAHSSQQMGSIAVYLFLRAMDGLLLLLLLLPP